MADADPTPVSTGPSDADADEAVNEQRLHAYSLERVVFFSDAVFAIAITLLAIALRLPDLPPGQTDATLLAALADLWPEIFAFVVSFFVIAAFWVGHYRTFRYVVAADGRLVAINFLFLFCIASLPFPTSIIASQGELPSAQIVYAAWVMVTGVLSTLLWVYPSQVANLVSDDASPTIVRAITYRAMVTPVLFAASIPVALVAPRVTWVIWLLSAPIQILVTRWVTRRPGRAPPEDPSGPDRPSATPPAPGGPSPTSGGA